MKIPFAKPELGDEEIHSVSEVIRSGWVTQGPVVQDFEKSFTEYCDAQHAVAVSSCTTALHLALIVSGVQRGDEVIVTPHSYVASANAILYVGARPVFVDIDPATLNIDPELIDEAVTERTKAILVVHQVGHPADLARIGEIASRFDLAVIEDAACAIGSEYNGMKIGGNRYSPLVAFSFHPRKVMTTGDGGMLTTDNEEFDSRLRRLRQHGMSVSDLARHSAGKIVEEQYIEPGYNYRLTDIQAAIGCVQLKRLPDVVQKRRRLAERYNEAFAEIEGISLFVEPSECLWNHQTYLIRLAEASASRRNLVMENLLEKGVATRRGVTSIHREPAYMKLYGHQSFPESEQASDQCIALPMFASMSDSQQEHVIESVIDTLNR